MERRDRSRAPKDSPIDHDPEFFEVFLPDIISHQLRIPPDFVKHFDRVIPETVILKDLCGQVWHVDLKQEETGVFFDKGWNRFVKDKSLTLGEFMVFRYNTSSAIFTVRLFGLDACKRIEDRDFKEPFAFVKEEQESDQTSIPICKRNYQNLNPKRLKRSIGDSKEEIFRKRPRNCSKGAKRRGLEAEKNGFSTMTDYKESIRPETRVHGSKRAKGYKGNETQPIRFTTSVSPTKLSHLHIPKRVIDDHNIKVRPYAAVLVYNQKGKSWPAKILTTADGRTLLGHGWMKFKMDNSLQVNESIELMLVLDKSRECKEFHVKATGSLWTKRGGSKKF